MRGVLRVPLQGQFGGESGRASVGPEAALFQEPRQVAQRTSHEWTRTLCFWSHRGSRRTRGPGGCRESVLPTRVAGGRPLNWRTMGCPTAALPVVDPAGCGSTIGGSASSRSRSLAHSLAQRKLLRCSALVPNPDRNKNRGHQTAATIVVVGAEGQPNHVAEQSNSNQGEEEFVHARACGDSQPSGGEQGCRSGCFMSGAEEAPAAGSAQSERSRL